MYIRLATIEVTKKKRKKKLLRYINIGYDMDTMRLRLYNKFLYILN